MACRSAWTAPLYDPPIGPTVRSCHHLASFCSATVGPHHVLWQCFCGACCLLHAFVLAKSPAGRGFWLRQYIAACSCRRIRHYDVGYYRTDKLGRYAALPSNAYSWQAHSWRVSPCMSEGLMWSTGRGLYAPNSTLNISKEQVGFWELEGRCFRVPGQADKRMDDNTTSGQLYDDTYTLPCTFPGSMPFAKLVDQLVFLTELEEL